MTVSAAEPGLRERKKAATKLALHTAAVQLAIEHGVDNVTVEAIADAVGVSRRTFSNYFANKEEALLHGDQERIRALMAMVRARPPDETAWVALSRAAEEHYRELGELDQAWVAQVRLVRTQPGLIAAQAQAFAALERELEAAVAARIPHPNSVRPALTAAVFLSTLRVSVQIWLEQPPGTLLLGDVVKRALAEAGRGFDR
jgi:AcrR family transcriptional regulator